METTVLKKASNALLVNTPVFFVVDQAENGDCEERWSKNVFKRRLCHQQCFHAIWCRLHQTAFAIHKENGGLRHKINKFTILVKNTILIDCKGASRNHGAYMFGGKHQIQNEK